MLACGQKVHSPPINQGQELSLMDSCSGNQYMPNNKFNIMFKLVAHLETKDMLNGWMVAIWGRIRVASQHRA